MRIKTRNRIDRLAQIGFTATGYLIIAILLGVAALLAVNTWAFFTRVPSWSFLTGLEWEPTGRQPRYGLLPMLTGTILVTLISLLLSIPIGIGCAAYLAGYAPRRLRLFLKPVIEMLSAVPSVVIGFIGIVALSPFLAWITHQSNGLNALNGAILLAVMSLPTIISITQDALDSVPESYKEASYGLGATRWQTLTRVTIPAASPGIMAAAMLGLGRAVGETMTVLMATGNAAAFPNGLFSSVRTLTATIAIELGEVPFQTTHYYSLFTLGAVLFLMTFIANLLGERYITRLKKYL